MFDEGCSVHWRDVNPPAGWLLNSRRVPVLPVPCEGCEWCDEINRCRFILPPDLCEDLAFAIDSYNCPSGRGSLTHATKQDTSVM
jgi:hypothetical protein